MYVKISQRTKLRVCIVKNFRVKTGYQKRNVKKSTINNRSLIVDPSFSSKTFLRRKNSIIVFIRDNIIIAKKSEQYNDQFFAGKEIRKMSDKEGGIVVFQFMLNHNQKVTDPFFTKRYHKDLGVCYLSQSYFKSPKTAKRNNSNINILREQS